MSVSAVFTLGLLLTVEVPPSLGSRIKRTQDTTLSEDALDLDALAQSMLEMDEDYETHDDSDDESKRFLCKAKDYHYQMLLPDGEPLSVLFERNKPGAKELPLTTAVDQVWATSLGSDAEVKWKLLKPNNMWLSWGKATVTTDLLSDVQYIRRVETDSLPDLLEIKLLNGDKLEIVGGTYFPEHIIKHGLKSGEDSNASVGNPNEEYTADVSVQEGVTTRHTNMSYAAGKGFKIGSQVAHKAGLTLLVGLVSTVVFTTAATGGIMSGLVLLPVGMVAVGTPIASVAGGVVGSIVGMIGGSLGNWRWRRQANAIASEHLWTKLTGWCMQDNFKKCGSDIIAPLDQECPTIADLKE